MAEKYRTAPMGRGHGGPGGFTGEKAKNGGKSLGSL